MSVNRTVLPEEDDVTCFAKLVVADASLLIRPAVPEQYPPSARHDSEHAYGVLSIPEDEGRFIHEIICIKSPDEASKMLDPVFRAFLDMYSMVEIWCDARVRFCVGDAIAQIAEYGMDDGSFTWMFNVHCVRNEDEAKKLLEKLKSEVDDDVDYVVVKPSSGALGYEATKYVAEDPSDYLDVDRPDLDEDILCQGICGQPDYACSCDETEAYRALEANIETRDSYFVA